MSGVDLHDLRMQEFPHNVKLALRKLEQTLQENPNAQTAAVQQHIIDEFILSSHNVEQHKGKLSKVLSSAVSDMMVVRILCDHLSSGQDPSILNAVMMLLFHPSLIEASAAQTASPYSIPKAPHPYSRNPYSGHGAVGGVASSGNPYMNPQMHNGRQYSLAGNFYGMNQSKKIASQDVKNSNPYLRAVNSQESKIASRLNTLSSLMSLAVATKNSKVLERIAVWMQEVCCLSGWCCQVSKRLIAEYCSIKPDATASTAVSLAADTLPGDAAHPLDCLPSISPLFTSSLITSWAELYSKLGASTVTPCSRPPASVVRLIVRWLSSSPPSLLVTALTSPTTFTCAGSVFGGPSLPPAPATAIAPLLRWCVEAPFFLRTASTPKSSLLAKESGDTDDVFGKRLQQAEAGSVYSELLLCLLRCLQAVPAVLPAPLSRQILSYQHLTVITEGLTRLLDPEKMEVDSAPLKCAPSISLQFKGEAVNRLAQAVLVAKRSGALYGSPLELSNALRRLPVYNRLVKILLTSELNC